MYGCWGVGRLSVWSESPELSPKLTMMGNSRSDLLGAIGKIFLEIFMV